MMWTISNVRDPVAMLILDVQAQFSSQGANYNRTFGDGSPHQIRPQITTLHVVLVMREQQIGSLKVVSLENGNPLVPYCGFTESVRSLYHLHPTPTDDISRSGLRQERTLVRPCQTMLPLKYLPSSQLHNCQRHNFPTRQWTGFCGLLLFRL